ncbi:MAG: PucR family transcriptional regulator [Olsenella sp.]|nr:PucR family transcriptional regulator [Olsenella sp.]
MIYTVSDFMCTYKDSVRLVAGQGGLSRQIEEVGILDYELMGGLRSKYQRENFYTNQLVVSSFLYARDDAFQIVEAVKYLVSKGVSGLVIKNVFHLQIPDGAIRYANARNFPLFLATSDDLFFDEVIIRVGEQVRSLADGNFAEREIDALLRGNPDAGEVRRRALGLNPSFGDEHRATFFLLDDDVTTERLAELERGYRRSAAAGVGNIFCHCAAGRDGGLLYVESSKAELGDHAEEMARTLLADVLDQEAGVAVGVSDVHYDLAEFAHALREAIRAAQLARRRAGGAIGPGAGVGARAAASVVGGDVPGTTAGAADASALTTGGANIACYASLGITRAILPHADSPEMRAFAQDVLGPLREFDAEHGSQLLATLEAFVACEQSARATAEALGQHVNTVRYRLEKVTQVTGLDHRVPSQMAQLVLACTVERCQEVLAQE